MPNSNQRGSSYARRDRKLFLLAKFGDGEKAPCWECGAEVDFTTMVVDRIISERNGGTYRRNNIRVHCRPCSDRQGGLVTQELRRKGMAVATKQRKLLQERAEHMCEVARPGCFRRADNAHHRKNASQGGTDDLSNLLLLCGSGTTGCHGWITEHPGEAKRNGWSTWRSDTPADVPLLYRGTWVRLDDHGYVHVIPEGEVRNDLGHLSIRNN